MQQDLKEIGCIYVVNMVHVLRSYFHVILECQVEDITPPPPP